MGDTSRLHVAHTLSRRDVLRLAAGAGTMLLGACAPVPAKPAGKPPQETQPTAAPAPSKRASVSVLVKDAHTGQPVEGATVKLAHVFAGVHEEETTPASGEVTFPNMRVMSTPYGVTVEKEGYTAKSLEVTLQAGENEVEVELSPAS